MGLLSVSRVGKLDVVSEGVLVAYAWLDEDADRRMADESAWAGKDKIKPEPSNNSLNLFKKIFSVCNLIMAGCYRI